MKPDSRFAMAAACLAVASCYPLAAAAQETAAGTVQFAIGEVTVLRQGATLPLRKGFALQSGDVLATGPDGRVQVRFSDGGLVALQPATRFAITEYADRQDPKQDRYLVSLVQGGLRSITGLIGKRNRDNYKVQTPTALIGIRGSAFTAYVDPADRSLKVAGEQDAIEVCTAAGCVGLTVGESALVRPGDGARLPLRTAERASLPVAPPVQAAQTVANQSDEQGRPLRVAEAAQESGVALPSPSPAPSPPGVSPVPPVPPAPPAPPTPPAPAPVTPPAVPAPPAPAPPALGSGSLSVSGVGITTAGGVNFVQTRQLQGAASVDDGANRPTQFAAGTTTGVLTGSAGATTYRSGTSVGGIGDLLVLGSWNNASWTTAGVGSTDLRYAYVAGIPTTLALNFAGQRASYSLQAATPVYTDSNRAGSVLSATLNVDFVGAGSSLGQLAIGLNLPRTDGITSAVYSLTGTLAGSGSSLAGRLSTGGADCSSGLDACQSGWAQGFFVGLVTANKVGLSFNGATANVGGFGGALAFEQTSLIGLTPTVTGSAAATYVSSFAYLDSTAAPRQLASTDDGSRYDFAGVELTRARARNSQPDIAKSGIGAARAGGIGTPGSADFIGWGSWDTANVTGASGPPAASNVHYIVATPTPDLSMPLLGTASYALVGGSAPVSSTLGTGTLDSASMAVNFGNATVAARMDLGFAGNRYTVTGNGQFRQTGQAQAVIAPAAGGGAGIPAVINGVFSGAGAYRAGIAYGVLGDAVLGNVNGAAVFQKVGN